MVHPSALAYPRTSKNVPLFNSKMFSDLFDVPGFNTSYSITNIIGDIVLYQVPSGVFLEARAPGKGKVIIFEYCDAEICTG